MNIPKPTLMALMHLSTCEGEDIYIIEESANSYRRIGTILLNDRYGNRVETIESDAKEKGERIITEIYKKWMAEDENYSWTKLTECFRACSLNRLAFGIEQHFGIPSSIKTQAGTCSYIIYKCSYFVGQKVISDLCVFYTHTHICVVIRHHHL